MVSHHNFFPIYCAVWTVTAAHMTTTEDTTDTNRFRDTDYRYEIWIYAIIGSILIGLSGIFPLLVIPIQSGQSVSHGVSAKTLNRLLSFAVGGLLGDVFLHLLPEVWHQLSKDRNATHLNHVLIGFWVLLGIFTFIILEKIFSQEENDDLNSNQLKDHTKEFNNKSEVKQRYGDVNTIVHRTKSSNEKTNGHQLPNGYTVLDKQNNNDKNNKQVTGYLNLLANGIDNFTHGLAVAGSFLVSTKIGFLTTLAILLHEIPHEIGDFAILLRSGFTRWEAAKAQMMTATVGLFGAVTALSVDSVESLGGCVSWILPFTAGCFLNIALVGVLPDLLKEKDLRQFMNQLVFLFIGVGVMAVTTFLCE